MGNSVVRAEQVRVRCSTFFHLQDAAYDRPHSLRSNYSKGSPRVPLYIEAILITSIPRPTLLPSLPFLTPLLPFSFMGHPCCLLPFLPPPPQTGQTVLVRNRPRRPRPPLTCARGHRTGRCRLEGQVVHGEVVFLALFLHQHGLAFLWRRTKKVRISWALPSSAESPDSAACE